MANTTAIRLWIRETQRCAVPGCTRPHYPDPHHVRPKGMGGVADEEAVDVENVAPLCHSHHRQGHAIGWVTFGRRYPVDLKLVAVETWARWMRVPEATRGDYARRAA